MADLQWVGGEDVKASAALKAVRNDADDTTWAYILFAEQKGPNSQLLKFGGTGSGSVDDLVPLLGDEQIIFALVRVTDKIDLTTTVKFVWLSWVGSKAPRMQVSRLSVQMGAIKKFFEPFSTDLSVNRHEEVSHAVIMEKVMAYSVSGSKVIDESTGTAQYRVAAGTAGANKVAAHSTRMAEGQVSFADGLRNDVRDVRDDSTTTNWVLAGYETPSTPNLVLLGKGAGGIPELRAYLTDDNVAYGIVRKVETIDNTEAIKFCYLRWLGKNIPRMQRAKLGTHAGDIAEFFAPAHTSLDAPDLDEITDENIMRLIQIASGTYKHVLSDDDARSRPGSVARPAPASGEASASRPAAASRKPATTTPKVGLGGTVQTLEDAVLFGDGIREAIQSVRSDDNDINWALASYEFAPGKNQSKNVVLIGTGAGGLPELKSYLKDDIVAYALYRTTERVDDSETVKFVFLDWRGPKIHRMQRAVLSTHSGAVRSLFQPYHVDVLEADKQDEISDEIITAKIKKAAGTANYVF